MAQPKLLSSRRNKKYIAIAVVIIVGLAVALIAGWELNNRSNTQSPSSTTPLPFQLTLANFNSTVGDDPLIQQYVVLQVSTHGINGNKVYCTGSMTLNTTEYTLHGYALDLLVTSNSHSSPYAVDVQLIGFGTSITIPTNGYSIINYTSVQVPTLGSGTNVYHFSLETPCSPLS